MIPIELFICLVAVDIILIIYTFLDNRNDIYGNVLTAIVSTVLSFVLSMEILNGSVGAESYAVSALNTTAENLTVYSYELQSVAVTEPALSLIFAGIAVVMGIVSVALVFDIFLEQARNI